MKAKELVAAIKARFAGSAYIVLEQVPDATGYDVGRWADVAVFSMWPSRGLTRSVFEVKVSRQDMLEELRTPAKHQWARESFHEFWFVTPKDIVALEELPTWAGLMVPHGKGLRIIRQATYNEAPVLNDHLLAAFIRATVKNAKKENVESLKAMPEYQRAAMYKEAVDEVLANHNKVFWPNDVQSIVTALTNLDMDEKTREDREHLLSVLRNFQEQIVGLFGLYATIANRSLLAKDDMGKYIVKVWGGHYESLDDVRELKKKVYGDQGNLYRLIGELERWVPDQKGKRREK